MRGNRYCDTFAFATHAARLPVISVGNISVGGTGKTPLVIEIVRRLRASGRRPAILTRGYAAKRGQTADEVLEYALAVPETPVVVNPDRTAGAETARLEYGADCVVLDDGFQHRWLRRDLDIVVIDALDPWGGERLLPEGRLREPLHNWRGPMVRHLADQSGAPATRGGDRGNLTPVCAPRPDFKSRRRRGRAERGER